MIHKHASAQNSYYPLSFLFRAGCMGNFSAAFFLPEFRQWGVAEFLLGMLPTSLGFQQNFQQECRKNHST
jgi:hypothetical protein